MLSGRVGRTSISSFANFDLDRVRDSVQYTSWILLYELGQAEGPY